MFCFYWKGTDTLKNITIKAFDLICKKYQETKNDEVIIELPFELREKRNEIGNDLKYNGCIVNFDLFGKCYFRCTITQEVIKSFNEW